jgi:hypothetical protein
LVKKLFVKRWPSAQSTCPQVDFVPGHQRHRGKRNRRDKQKERPSKNVEKQQETQTIQPVEENIKYVDAPLPKINPWKIKSPEESEIPEPIVSTEFNLNSTE